MKKLWDLKTKKRLCAVMATTMAASVVMSGCGKPAEKKATSPDELEHVELTYYIVGSGEPKDQPIVNEAISEYIKDKINASINIRMFDYNSYDSKINSMIAGGEAFDLLFTSNGNMPYATSAQKGAFLELDELLDEYGPNVKAALGDFFLEGAKVDGKIYGIPTNKEKAHHYGYLLRKDLVEKYNMDISTIKTLADLEPFLEIIKQNEPNVYPISARPKMNLWKYYDMESVSGSGYTPGAIAYNKDEKKIINQYETEEYMELAKLMRRFNEKGYIRKDAATNVTVGEDELYFAKDSSLKPGAAESVSNDKVSWVQVDMTEPITVTSNATGAMVAIPATSKNPERAMMFLDLLYSDQKLLDMLYYGIEGTHYTRVSDKVVEPVANNTYSNLGNRWRYGNQVIASITTTEDPNQWAAIDEYNKIARPLECLGFSFDPASVKTEMGACENVYAEFAPLINTGSGDPEVLVPQLVEKLKEAGSDKIMAELEKQYEEFLKTK